MPPIPFCSIQPSCVRCAYESGLAEQLTSRFDSVSCGCRSGDINSHVLQVKARSGPALLFDPQFGSISAPLGNMLGGGWIPQPTFHKTEEQEAQGSGKTGHR